MSLILKIVTYGSLFSSTFGFVSSWVSVYLSVCVRGRSESTAVGISRCLRLVKHFFVNFTLTLTQTLRKCCKEIEKLSIVDVCTTTLMRMCVYMCLCHYQNALLPLFAFTLILLRSVSSLTLLVGCAAAASSSAALTL